MKDDNEFAPVFISDSVHFEVTEGIPLGSVVGVVSASDADSIGSSNEPSNSSFIRSDHFCGQFYRQIQWQICLTTFRLNYKVIQFLTLLAHVVIQIIKTSNT